MQRVVQEDEFVGCCLGAYILIAVVEVGSACCDLLLPRFFRLLTPEPRLIWAEGTMPRPSLPIIRTSNTVWLFFFRLDEVVM